MREFGRKVRTLRQSHEWSQEDLAYRMTAWGLRMHQTQIAKIEAGTRSTTIEELSVLARILETSVSELMQMPANEEGRRVIEGVENIVRQYERDLKLIDQQLVDLMRRKDEAERVLHAARARLRTAQQAYGQIPEGVDVER